MLMICRGVFYITGTLAGATGEEMWEKEERYGKEEKRWDRLREEKVCSRIKGGRRGRERR